MNSEISPVGGKETRYSASGKLLDRMSFAKTTVVSGIHQTVNRGPWTSGRPNMSVLYLIRLLFGGSGECFDCIKLFWSTSWMKLPSVQKVNPRPVCHLGPEPHSADAKGTERFLVLQAPGVAPNRVGLLWTKARAQGYPQQLTCVGVSALNLWSVKTRYVHRVPGFWERCVYPLNKQLGSWSERWLTILLCP